MADEITQAEIATEETAVQAAAASTEAPQDLSTTLTDEQFLAEVERRTGRKLGSVDELKPAPEEPTEAEKQQKLSIAEKKLLDKAIAKGKKVEDFVAIKQLAEFDPEQLSILNKKLELKAAGYSDAQIDEKLKERYFQYSDEEIAEYDEEQQAQLKAAKAHYEKKLKTGSQYQIDAAKKYLSDLQAEIDAENLEAEVDASISLKVEEKAKTLPRKIDIELGKNGNIDIAPIQFEFSEEAIKKATETLKDKAARESFLYNADGTENVEAIFDLILWKESAIELAKKAHIVSANQQVEIMERKGFSKNTHFVAPASQGKVFASNGIGKAISAEVSKANTGDGGRKPI